MRTGKPELALYQRIYEGPGFRKYLQRSAQGEQAAQTWSQLRYGTSMLRQHDSRFRDQHDHDREDRICPACAEPDRIEYVQHVLLHCPAYEHHLDQTPLSSGFFMYGDHQEQRTLLRYGVTMRG